MARIAVIPGDGIGNEVIPEGIRVIEHVIKHHAPAAGLALVGVTALFAAACIHFSPRRLVERARERFVALPAFGQALVLVLVACALSVAAYDTAPFIYFQF